MDRCVNRDECVWLLFCLSQSRGFRSANMCPCEVALNVVVGRASHQVGQATMADDAGGRFCIFLCVIARAHFLNVYSSSSLGVRVIAIMKPLIEEMFSASIS